MTTRLDVIKVSSFSFTLFSNTAGSSSILKFSVGPPPKLLTTNISSRTKELPDFSSWESYFQSGECGNFTAGKEIGKRNNSHPAPSPIRTECHLSTASDHRGRGGGGGGRGVRRWRVGDSTVGLCRVSRIGAKYSLRRHLTFQRQFLNACLILYHRISSYVKIRKKICYLNRAAVQVIMRKEAKNILNCCAPSIHVSLPWQKM